MVVEEEEVVVEEAMAILGDVFGMLTVALMNVAAGGCGASKV